MTATAKESAREQAKPGEKPPVINEAQTQQATTPNLKETSTGMSRASSGVLSFVTEQSYKSISAVLKVANSLISLGQDAQDFGPIRAAVSGMLTGVAGVTTQVYEKYRTDASNEMAKKELKSLAKMIEKSSLTREEKKAEGEKIHGALSRFRKETSSVNPADYLDLLKELKKDLAANIRTARSNRSAEGLAGEWADIMNGKVQPPLPKEEKAKAATEAKPAANAEKPKEEAQKAADSAKPEADKAPEPEKSKASFVVGQSASETVELKKNETAEDAAAAIAAAKKKAEAEGGKPENIIEVNPSDEKDKLENAA
jgi:hypothetical protein